VLKQLGDGEYTSYIGKMSKDPNKNCRAQRHVFFEVEDVIQECLFAFPDIWASIQFLIEGSFLIMLHLSNLQHVRADSYLCISIG
jgi:hypothetical protein